MIGGVHHALLIHTAGDGIAPHRKILQHSPAAAVLFQGFP
jgi:hypothetical protein